ncbi:hypothetical protein [Vibrio phage vB_VhaS-a]|nr:hypothetical protein [Vibrio phage vB_VhaS-a]
MTAPKAPRLMLNPATGIKVITVGGKKFSAGVKKAFNKTTRDKYLKKRHQVGLKTVPMFIEVEAEDHTDLSRQPSYGSNDLMDRTDAKTDEQILAAGEDGNESGDGDVELD